MKVAFRADASLQIGAGHIMRCLALADVLRARGWNCEFICREHPGHLNDLIRSKQYIVHSLPISTEYDDELVHYNWLGSTQVKDAQCCISILTDFQPDWVVVDHYSLDARWECLLAPHCHQLMVIDDLADRPHICQLLLDQTFGRMPDDYRSLVPRDCELLCGSAYAMLRPEFSALREYSLTRRRTPQFKRLLVSLGGVDKDNVTSDVLNALRNCSLPNNCNITVVMGATAPWCTEVKKLAEKMPWPTNVLVGVSNMAQVMADSDLIIGAAGSSAWERCSLGVPTIMVVLAQNQHKVASALASYGAALCMTKNQIRTRGLCELLSYLIEHPFEMLRMVAVSASITDGVGAIKVAGLLEK